MEKAERYRSYARRGFEDGAYDLACFLAQQSKEAALRRDPAAEVYLFGSYAEGAARPDSDVDVLVVSDALGKDLLSVAEAVDKITAELGVKGVFEIHIATRDLFERWYRGFIDVLIPTRC